MSEPTLAEIIGDPKRLDAELQKFRRDTKLLSSRRMNLIAKYPKRWVAICQVPPPKEGGLSLDR